MSVESPSLGVMGMTQGQEVRALRIAWCNPGTLHFLRQSRIALADLATPPPIPHPILPPRTLVLGWQASISPGVFNASLKLLPTRPVGSNLLPSSSYSPATHGHRASGVFRSGPVLGLEHDSQCPRTVQGSTQLSPTIYTDPHWRGTYLWGRPQLAA